MKSYQAIETINGLYEKIVDYRHSENKQSFTRNQGIALQVRITSECLGYEQDGNTHHPEWEGRGFALFNVIILNHHKVFTHIDQDTRIRGSNLPQTNWKNTSNHDSCWRQGCDELTALGFQAAREAYINLPEDQNAFAGSLDSRINLKLGFGIGGTLFKLVEVEYEDDLELDPSGYHKKITSVIQIEKSILL